MTKDAGLNGSKHYQNSISTQDVKSTIKFGELMVPGTNTVQLQ
jgi:hypothetical protein